MRVAALSRLCALLVMAAAVTPVVAQERLRVAVTVVTLDQLRQIQAAYGRAMLDSLFEPRRGRFDRAAPTVEAAVFGSCVDDRMGRGLDYCIRFYLTRAELPADAPPTVVVVFDDDQGEGRPGAHGETMRVTCSGRGVVPGNAAAQDTWLWPGAARMHGVNDQERDRDALAACIAAAAGEAWTGLRQPDPSS